MKCMNPRLITLLSHQDQTKSAVEGPKQNSLVFQREKQNKSLEIKKIKVLLNHHQGLLTLSLYYEGYGQCLIPNLQYDIFLPQYQASECVILKSNG